MVWKKTTYLRTLSDSGHPHLSGSQWRTGSQRCADENARITCHNLKAGKSQPALKATRILRKDPQLCRISQTSQRQGSVKGKRGGRKGSGGGMDRSIKKNKVYIKKTSQRAHQLNSTVGAEGYTFSMDQLKQ